MWQRVNHVRIITLKLALLWLILQKSRKIEPNSVDNLLVLHIIWVLA